MSLPEPKPDLTPKEQQLDTLAAKEETRRRSLLLVLLLLLLVLCVVLFVSIRYFLKPGPLPDMLPKIIAQNINYPPTYKSTIKGVNNPVGVAVSADAQRVYVTEGSGERLIKMFSRDGNLIQSFSPPGTTPSNRQPTYIAVHADGRVFVTDIYNDTIDVFDPSGNFIDAIIGTQMTLSKFVAARNNGDVPDGTLYFYNNIDKKVYWQLPGQKMDSAEITSGPPWGPMGLHFDNSGNLLVTNVADNGQRVVIFPADAIKGSWINFNPQVKGFGIDGKGDGQLWFPNGVVEDSKGNYYVSDGNNGRISLWNSNLEYLTFFGFGSDEASFNLPRGLWMDSKDHLHVADAVGQSIRVYDVSGSKPVYLFSFGEFGISEGMFNYPTDITVDSSGRLYIADRENNRIEIWSY